MESKAKLVDISRDYKTGKLRLSFVLESATPEDIEGIRNHDLRLRAVRWREKRSLDANAYYWKLVSEIASLVHTSKEELHELMLSDYGCIDTLEDGTPITITVRSDIDISILEGHYKKYKESEDGRFIGYLKLKGSSEMDSKEMSTLIDGVIYEAQELGIDTIRPDEKELMLQQWDVDLNRQSQKT